MNTQFLTDKQNRYNWYLGVDTSNYTTSVAAYCPQLDVVLQSQKLLPVPHGQRGLRQSEALFHHVRQLPPLMEELFLHLMEENYRIYNEYEINNISAIGVSTRPRPREDSYMPCFLAGESVARAIAASKNIPLVNLSHQEGHIIASMYSSKRLNMLSDDVKNQFIAFHVSGGTTDCLLIKKYQNNIDDNTITKNKIIDIQEIGTSNDLHAGQLIDRVGVMMGLSFPSGREMELLATTWCNNASKLLTKNTHKNHLNNDKNILFSHEILNKCFLNYNINFKNNDLNCSLSGMENKCRKLWEDTSDKGCVSYFCLYCIFKAIENMTKKSIDKLGSIPIIYAGGVMSNSLIKNDIYANFNNVYFADPQFSRDNAAGVAIYAYLCNDFNKI